MAEQQPIGVLLKQLRESKGLRLKALEALDIQVTYTPEKDIIIDGLLPVGVTEFGMSSHVEKRNALPFRFCVQIKKDPRGISPGGK